MSPWSRKRRIRKRPRKEKLPTAAHPDQSLQKNQEDIGLKKKKDACSWWDVGIVNPDATSATATVSLMNVEDGRVLHCAASIPVEFRDGMGFAMVESKLYAFGRHRNFFVFDLEGESKNYEFKMAGELQSPKSAPVVIPFRNKRIFVIATNGGRPAGGWWGLPEVEFPYCEVINLRSLRAKPMKTPFDKAYQESYDSRRAEFPWSDGHVILGDNAYFQIRTHTWGYVPRIYRLDMAKNQWFLCYDPNFATPRHLAYVDDHEDPPDDDIELPNFLRCIAYWPDVNVVGDHFFDLDVFKQARPNQRWCVGTVYQEDLKVWPLTTLKTYIEKHVPEKFSLASRWVMSLDLGDDLYCLLAWIVDCKINFDLFTCKFRWLKGQAGAMDAVEDVHTPVPYDCNVLSHKIFSIPRAVHASYAFTREDYCGLHP